MGMNTTHGSVIRTISIHYLTTFVVVRSLVTLHVVIRPEGRSCKRIVIDVIGEFVYHKEILYSFMYCFIYVR